jgi:hypothetical protein
MEDFDPHENAPNEQMNVVVHRRRNELEKEEK